MLWDNGNSYSGRVVDISFLFHITGMENVEKEKLNWTV